MTELSKERLEVLAAVVGYGGHVGAPATRDEERSMAREILGLREVVAARGVTEVVRRGGGEIVGFVLDDRERIAELETAQLRRAEATDVAAAADRSSEAQPGNVDLDDCLILADAIDRNGGTEPFDIESSLLESAKAAQCLRKLVGWLRAAWATEDRLRDQRLPKAATQVCPITEDRVDNSKMWHCPDCEGKYGPPIQTRTRCTGCGHFNNELEYDLGRCSGYGDDGHHMVPVDARGIAIPPRRQPTPENLDELLTHTEDSLDREARAIVRDVDGWMDTDLPVTRTHLQSVSARLKAVLKKSRPGQATVWHHMPKPGIASCGADYANMAKTDSLWNVTCIECLRNVALRAAYPPPPAEVCPGLPSLKATVNEAKRVLGDYVELHALRVKATGQREHLAKLEAGRRDELEKFARWIVDHWTLAKDWACVRCAPKSNLLVDGFACVAHRAVDIVDAADLRRKAEASKGKSSP